MISVVLFITHILVENGNDCATTEVILVPRSIKIAIKPTNNQTAGNSGKESKYDDYRVRNGNCYERDISDTINGGNISVGGDNLENGQSDSDMIIENFEKENCYEEVDLMDSTDDEDIKTEERDEFEISYISSNIDDTQMKVELQEAESF